jgi:hypothetical protein
MSFFQVVGCSLSIRVKPEYFIEIRDFKNTVKLRIYAADYNIAVV